jgi:hypothetical protein
MEIAIFGSGPSLLELDLPALSTIPTCHTMAINTSDPRGVYDYWLIIDHSQYHHSFTRLQAYQGIPILDKRLDHPGEHYQFTSLPGPGWSHDPTKGLFRGRSSVYTASQLALWMGFEQAYVSTHGGDTRVQFIV